MSDYADNYMTDEKNVRWVKMDYVNPIMKKTDLAMDKLEAKEKGLELDLGLAGVSIYESKVLLTSCENSLLRRDNLIESLEADNKVLTAKVDELQSLCMELAVMESK